MLYRERCMSYVKFIRCCYEMYFIPMRDNLWGCISILFPSELQNTKQLLNIEMAGNNTAIIGGTFSHPSLPCSTLATTGNDGSIAINILHKFSVLIYI